MHVFKNQILICPNILSYLIRIKYSDIYETTERLQKAAEALDLKVCGRIMTTVKSKTLTQSGSLSDIEFLVPVDRPFDSTVNYKYKPMFKLINAVRMRYEGDICGISESQFLLAKYLNENDLEPVTGHYFSYIQALRESPRSSIVDIYVGINSNIL